VDAKSEIREFLTSRRARVTPEQAGLRTYGTGQRRVPGLRRAHLFHLARAGQSSAPRRGRRAQQRIRPSVQHMLDAMTGIPAFVRNGRLDILAANRLGRAFYSQHFDSPHQPVNSARFAFLDPRAQSFYLDWESIARDMVAVLHEAAGRDPYDRGLSDLVGELSTRSETFRTLWAAHNVRRHDTGVKAVHHPLVGEVTFTYESMELVADPGLTMFVYTPEPGSKSEQALNLLASWTATPDHETTDVDHEEQPRDPSRAE
jgi:hypothetical protein